jgi:hypothetical protein
MLMLFYAVISGWFAFFSLLPKFTALVQKAWKLAPVNNKEMLFIVLFLLLFMICFIITKFFMFHISLVWTNSTTIESLENSQNARFSISPYWNFMQVFGKEWSLWLLPLYGKSGKPLGDGISWPLAGGPEGEFGGNLDSEPSQRESTVKQAQSFNRNGIWPVESPPPKETQNKGNADSDTDTSFIRLNNVSR